LNGLIFNLQRYSLHDGPGIRTVVFLKGCPLHCLWCCNPESQRMEPELEFRPSLCKKCGACISACPEDAIHPNVDCIPAEKINRGKCTLCGKCVSVCPNEALRISGQWMDPEKVFDECLKDADVYRRSGGGVTLSGGEPLFQPEFSLELLQKLFNRGIHTAIETSGFASWETFETIIPYIDLFLFDIKHTNSQKHAAITGIPNEGIIGNLNKLASRSKKIILRIPLIPGFNDDIENLNSIVKLSTSLSINEINLMPFHQFGKEKYVRFGSQYSLMELKGLQDTEGGRKVLLDAQILFSEAGINTVIGG
jgi:pyruvate formate lyase activating enzyme